MDYSCVFERQRSRCDVYRYLSLETDLQTAKGIVRLDNVPKFTTVMSGSDFSCPQTSRPHQLSGLDFQITFLSAEGFLGLLSSTRSTHSKLTIPLSSPSVNITPFVLLHHSNPFSSSFVVFKLFKISTHINTVDEDLKPEIGA